VEIDGSGKLTTLNTDESDKEVQDIAAARSRTAQKQRADFMDLLKKKEVETFAMINGKRQRLETDAVDEVDYLIYETDLMNSTSYNVVLRWKVP